MICTQCVVRVEFLWYVPGDQVCPVVQSAIDKLNKFRINYNVPIFAASNDFAYVYYCANNTIDSYFAIYNRKSNSQSYSYRHHNKYLYRVPTIDRILHDDPHLRAMCIRNYSVLRNMLLPDIAYYIIITLLNHMRLDDDSYIVC